MKIEKYIGRNGKPVDNKRKVSAKDGTTAVIELRGKNWRTRFAANGKHHQLNLRTTDERTAAATALDKVRAASREQWDFVHAGQNKKGVITIGQCIQLFIEQDVPTQTKRVSREASNRLRTLIRTALQIERKQVKDAESGEWVEPAIDKLPATILDRQLVKKFMKNRLLGYPEAGEARESRIRGANSLLGDAKSLFSKRNIVDKLYPGLPDISTFVEAPHQKCTPVEFLYEKIDGQVETLKANLPALKESDPSAYLLFQLAAGCGLRRTEALQARKEWITFYKGKRVLYVQPTETWVPKGRKIRRVPLSESVYDQILLLSDDSEFIIPAYSGNDRKQGIGRRLCKWFLSIGWTEKKKTHELRRWFGSEVSHQIKDLFAVQRLLGHASITTTESYYADIVKQPEYEINLTAEQPAEQAKAVG